MQYVKKTSLFIVIPLFLFFLLFYLHNLKTLAIQYYDEDWWVGRSFFFELFIKHDFKNLLWNGYFGYDQPKLTEYVFGAVLYPAYLKEKDIHKNYNFNKYLIDNNFFESDNFSYKDYKNKSTSFVDWRPGDTGNQKGLLAKYGTNFLRTINIIYTIRKFNSLLMTLNVVFIFFITLLFSNVITAAVVSILYGFNTIVIHTGLVAQPEALFLFCFYLGIFSLLILIKKHTLLIFKKNDYFWLIVFTISAAFCIATKLNGFILLILFNVLEIIILLQFLSHHKILGIRRTIITWFFVNLFILSIFILLDPYLYLNPLKNFLYMLHYRNDVSNWQMQAFGPALYSYKDRLLAVYNNFFGQKNISFNLLSFLGIKNQFLGNIYLILFIIGVVSMGARKKKNASNIQQYFLLFFTVTLITVILYLKLDWDRYYLPILYFILCYEVYGFIVLLKIFRKVFH